MTLDRDVVLASSNVELRRRITVGLGAARWRVREAKDGAETFTLLEGQVPKALIIDSWFPDLETASFQAWVRQVHPNLSIIELSSLSAHPTEWPHQTELLTLVRELVREGEARSSAKLARSIVEEAHGGLANPADDIAEEASGHNPIVELIGSSAPMRELTRLIRLVARHDSRVLIEGETGTGKELVARALHRLSARAHRPLVTLNCAAIPESLLESELFGYVRGAFTGAVQPRAGRIETAHTGTLFLDEIGELSPALQAKLLRFLENGELQRVGENDIRKVDVRVIAATHQHLDRKVQEGSFRLDLLHRLAVFPIEVPPLRDRVEDIPRLTKHILEQKKSTKRVRSEALELLGQHSWPGNVRELAHVVERAVILAEDAQEVCATHIKLRKIPRF